jgi:hypothetical protein
MNTSKKLKDIFINKGIWYYPIIGSVFYGYLLILQKTAEQMITQVITDNWLAFVFITILGYTIAIIVHLFLKFKKQYEVDRINQKIYNSINLVLIETLYSNMQKVINGETSSLYEFKTPLKERLPIIGVSPQKLDDKVHIKSVFESVIYNNTKIENLIGKSDSEMKLYGLEKKEIQVVRDLPDQKEQIKDSIKMPSVLGA